MMRIFYDRRDEDWSALKKLIWLFRLIKGGASVIIRTVTGTLPLFLTNSIAAALNRLVRYGKVTQPPVDYLSTVTQAGAVEQRDSIVLPSGWSRVEYIESDGGQYIDLDTAIDGNETIEVEFLMTSTTPTGQVFGYRDGDNRNNISVNIGSAKKIGIDYNNSSWSPYFVVTPSAYSANVVYQIVLSKARRAVYGDGTLLVEGTTLCGDTFSIPTVYALGIAGTPPTSSQHLAARLLSVKISGKRDCIPVYDGTEYALYDTVSETILHNAGTGAFTGGSVFTPTPTPANPMDLWCNNGKLRVKDAELPVGYRRLKDIIFDGDVYYVTNTYLTGADTTTFTINATENARNVLGCYTGVGTGDNISFYLNVGGGGNYVRYKSDLYRPQLNDGALGQDRTLAITPTGTTGFDTNASWTAQTFTCPDPLYIGWLANATSPKFLGTFKGNVTVSSRAKYIPCERQSDGEIGYYDVNSNTFFENQGTGTPTTSGYDDTHNTGVYPDGTPSTVTDADGNTATLETLLACGTYADTEEVIAGAISRAVVAMVLDGTEAWQSSSTTGIWYVSAVGSARSDARTALPCTHYTGTTEANATMPDNSIKLTVASNFPSNNAVYIKDTACADVAAFKAKLAALYAAGNPVIVLYPLATPTTESVPGQVLVNAPLTVSAEVTMPAPTTTEAAVSTPDPKHPLPLWCNNGELEYGQYGKNLFDISTVTRNYFISASGVITLDNASMYSALIPVSPNASYTLSGTAVNSSGNKRVHAYDANGDWITQLGYASSVPAGASYSVPVTTTASTAYIRISVLLTDTNVQLEEGSTATAYEPYHFGLHTDTPEVLTVSNNWFDRSEDYAVNNGKYINNSGAWTGSAGTAFLTLIAKLDEGKQYTVQRTTTDIGNCALRITAFDSSTPSNTSGHYSVIYLGTSSDTSYTFTVPTGFPYVAVYVRHSSGTATDEAVISAFKVYQGAYAEQTASVPMLLAVGNYRDEAELIAGIKTGKVGVRVLTGTENWRGAGEAGNYRYYLNDETFFADWEMNHTSGSSPALVCTHFAFNGYSSNGGAVQDDGFNAYLPEAPQGAYIRFKPKILSIETVDAFKAWLAAQYAAGNPVILLYPLITETTEQTTPQSLNSYNGVTLIDTECAVLPVDGEAEYKYGTTPTPPPVPDTDCIEFSSSAPFTLATANSTKNWDGTLYTSPDAITWSEWDGREAASSSSDGKLYVRGSGNTTICANASGQGWVLTGSGISCSGDIRYILDHDTPESTTMAEGCFYGLFRDCTALISAPELPADRLVSTCYREMFYGCTALTTPPELPAKTLAASCYRAMFYGCSSLTTAPALPATTLVSVCYYQMFTNCSSLTTPPALPATTLQNSCYSAMFRACTALVALPELPADRLATDCYYRMFYGCSAIKLSDREEGDYTVKYQTIPPVDTGSVEEQTDAAEMFKGTGGDFTGTPYSSTKYFLDKNNSVIPATRGRLAILAGSPQPDMSEEDAQTALNILTGGDR